MFFVIRVSYFRRWRRWRHRMKDVCLIEKYKCNQTNFQCVIQNDKPKICILCSIFAGTSILMNFEIHSIFVFHTYRWRRQALTSRMALYINKNMVCHMCHHYPSSLFDRKLTHSSSQAHHSQMNVFTQYGVLCIDVRIFLCTVNIAYHSPQNFITI